MPEIKRVGDLEIAVDMKAQRRNWKFQMFGSAVMALIALAGLLGLFGGAGPLSRAAAGDQGASLSVAEYERFLRFDKPTTLEVRLDDAATAGSEPRVWLNRGYVNGVEFQEIDPLPRRVEVARDRVYYVFDVGSDGPTIVTFELQPDEIGPLEVQVGLDGGPTTTFGQFVYP
jgi:hypothetical protein